MTRSFLRLVARTLIGVVFAAQAAVAAYACPGLAVVWAAQSPTLVAAAAEMHVESPGPDIGVACHEMAAPMDPASPTLCAEHCKQGQQSDQTSAVNVPAAVMTLRYALRPPAETDAVLRPAMRTARALVAVSPPHAILHCVFRI